MDRPGLAEFLRRRREALQPSDIGLPAGVRRRTVGLRREEVAAAVGMSTDYYTRLEQQRGPTPSDQMMAAIARGLRLTLDERDHLFRLAGHQAPRRVHRGPHVSPGLMRVLDRLEDTPALVITDVGETIAQNRLAAALYGDHTVFTGLDRSGVYRWFAHPEARGVYPERDHETQGRMQTAQLRVALAMPDADPLAAQVAAELRRTSDEFRRYWDLQEVTARYAEHKTVVHRELGEIEVDCQTLFTENQAQILLVLTASPGTESAQKLALLGVLGVQTFSDAQVSGD